MRYSHASGSTSGVHPILSRICLPYKRPNDVSSALITIAINIACSAALSAFTLSSDPMKRAIDAVTPLPKPKDIPITKKKIGKLNATAAMAEPLILPIKIISTIL